MLKSWLFLSVMVMMFLVLAGCADQQAETTTILLNPPTNAKVAVNDLVDVPRFPGAELIHLELPMPAGKRGTEEWVAWEVIAYRTNADIEKVRAFYETEMPAAGWRGQWQRLMDQSLQGVFRQDEAVVSTISISPGGEGTRIVIVRAVRQRQ